MCSVIQSHLTLCEPMNCSLPGSTVHGIFQARVPDRAAISSSRRFSQHRDETCVPCISCIGGWFLYHWVTWEALSRSRRWRLFNQKLGFTWKTHLSHWDWIASCSELVYLRRSQEKEKGSRHPQSTRRLPLVTSQLTPAFFFDVTFARTWSPPTLPTHPQPSRSQRLCLSLY